MSESLKTKIMEIYRQSRPYEPYEFAELADYNSRVAKGIVHTDAYVERMRAEQARFDEAMRATYSPIGSQIGSRKP